MLAESASIFAPVAVIRLRSTSPRQIPRAASSGAHRRRRPGCRSCLRGDRARGAMGIPDRAGGTAGGLAEVGLAKVAEEDVEVLDHGGLLAGFGCDGCRQY